MSDSLSLEGDPHTDPVAYTIYRTLVVMGVAQLTAAEAMWVASELRAVLAALSSEEPSLSPAEGRAATAGLDEPPPPLQSDFDRLKEEVERLTEERDEALRRKAHTEQWYAQRLEPIKDVAKRVGVWPEVAAIIANGSGTRLTESGYVYEPPTYAQQLNIANHRAKAAEARATQALARVAELERLYGA